MSLATLLHMRSGMADMEIDTSGKFLLEGGTELALMSTTDSRNVVSSPLSISLFLYSSRGL
jgi:hypothetical protein